MRFQKILRRHVTHAKTDGWHRLHTEQSDKPVVAAAAEHRAVVVRVVIKHFKDNVGVIIKAAHQRNVKNGVGDAAVAQQLQQFLQLRNGFVTVQFFR